MVSGSAGSLVQEVTDCPVPVVALMPEVSDKDAIGATGCAP
jgi:hypothetical protein